MGVAAPFRGRSFVYRETDLRYTSDFYTEFLVAPTAMLADGTARALERARVFTRIVPPGSPPEGDFLLDGFFDAFYVDLRDTGKPAAEAVATYFLSRGDPAAPVPFWSKQYRQRRAGDRPRYRCLRRRAVGCFRRDRYGPRGRSRGRRSAETLKAVTEPSHRRRSAARAPP